MQLPNTPTEGGVAIALSLWLALTVLSHLPFLGLRKIKRFDLFGAIPVWNFFAPRPGVYDYHLLFRDRLGDGTLTEWRELRLTERRRMSHAVWNPGKREKKAVLDLMVSLAEHLTVQKVSVSIIHLSIPYLHILGLIDSLDRRDDAVMTQFLVMISSGYAPQEDPKPFFYSEWHELSRKLSPGAIRRNDRNVGFDRGVHLEPRVDEPTSEDERLGVV